ncbi:hypothetical protein NFC81_14330 [Salinispirillum sp. LH 10-3-1]|uniref:Uncharacterized protein n=1 Tax=Salinispirillum sp. LH 10-3-1 TaxID=2952525 RepID=A0AB38YEX6_9GAMM
MLKTLCLWGRRLALLVLAALAPAYLLAALYGVPAFFVIASLLVVLGAVLLFVRQRFTGRKPQGWSYIAFTLALFLLVWQPMVALHAHYAPPGLAVVVNHLTYVIAGLVLAGLYFSREGRA